MSLDAIPILIGEWFGRCQAPNMARVDLQMIAVALGLYAERPADPSTAEVEFAEVLDLGFPCRQAVIRKGVRDIGLIMAFVAHFNDGSIVLLFAKEGRNLSLKDRNDIRAAYAEELRVRAMELPGGHDEQG